MTPCKPERLFTFMIIPLILFALDAFPPERFSYARGDTETRNCAPPRTGVLHLVGSEYTREHSTHVNRAHGNSSPCKGVVMPSARPRL